MPPMNPTSYRPLVVTEDPALLDELLRLAATAGCELEVATGAAAARRSWTASPLVLVGADAAAALARARLPRRSGVLLVADDLDDAGLWQRAVEVGAEQVVFLPDGDPWLVSRLADTAEGGATDCPLVVVLGGRGGAGATVLATALAVTAAREGRRTLLVDGDPLGGGIDLVLGAEDVPGVRWPALTQTRGRVPASALAEALPRACGLTVLSFDRDSDLVSVPAEAMRAVLSAGRRAHDLVVVDLPRTTGGSTDVALEAASLTLLVVPAEVRAAAAAARVASSVASRSRDLRVVTRLPAPSGLDGTAVAAALGLPLAGTLRPEPGLAAALDRGDAPAGKADGPLRALCHEVLRELLPALGRAA